jgi:hypothetical protein
VKEIPPPKKKKKQSISKLIKNNPVQVIKLQELGYISQKTEPARKSLFSIRSFFTTLIREGMETLKQTSHPLKIEIFTSSSHTELEGMGWI